MIQQYQPPRLRTTTGHNGATKKRKLESEKKVVDGKTIQAKYRYDCKVFLKNGFTGDSATIKASETSNLTKHLRTEGHEEYEKSAKHPEPSTPDEAQKKLKLDKSCHQTNFCVGFQAPIFSISHLFRASFSRTDHIRSTYIHTMTYSPSS
jgi:hypothetical protein